MFLKLVFCCFICIVDICSVGSADGELLQVHRTFLQELLNNRDELVKVKHELSLKKQEEGQMAALREELQTLKNQLFKKIANPDQALSQQSRDEVLNEMKDIGAELIRFGLKRKSKILQVLQAIKKFLLGRKNAQVPALPDLQTA